MTHLVCYYAFVIWIYPYDAPFGSIDFFKPCHPSFIPMTKKEISNERAKCFLSDG